MIFFNAITDTKIKGKITRLDQKSKIYFFWEVKEVNGITEDERGIYLRNIRKSKKKRIKDYADENISTTTISNIETGNESVSIEKVKYYCKKLGVDFHKLPKMIQRKKEKEFLKEERIKSKLKRIEHLIEFNNVKKGLKHLRKLNNIPESLKHYALYLKGRGYAEKNNTTKAKQFFLKAIKHVETNQKYIYDNIHANAYNQLAKLSYYQNNFEQALIYTNQGINQFVKNGKQKHLWFSLNMNKAVYLERLGYNAEAKEIIKMLLKHQSEIDNVEVILNMYDVQGSINRKMGLYDEAIESCRKGLELAQINKKNNRAIELWITLGSIYFDMDNLIEAEECLLVALDLKSRSKDYHIYLPAYIKLGQIYTRQSKYQEAQTVLNDAINAGRNTRIISTYIPAFVALGDCFYKQRLYNDAIRSYNSALKFAKKHNLLSHEKEILYKLCLCYENVDKKTFLNTLVKYFKKNVELDSRNKKGGFL